VFVRASNNLIDYVLTNSNNITNLDNLLPDTTYFYTQNLAKSITYGYEFSGSYEFLKTDTSFLKFTLNYTYLKTTNAVGVISKYIANHPIHSIAPRIIARYNRFRVSTTANFITRNPEEIPSINGKIPNQYLLLNARISFKPPIVPARIFIEGRNLLNTDYQEIIGSQMPMRWIYGGFVWNWGEKLSS